MITSNDQKQFEITLVASKLLVITRDDNYDFYLLLGDLTFNIQVTATNLSYDLSYLQ